MILYFADRELNILGLASTELRQGLRVRDDNKSEDVETGVAIFECKIEFDLSTRLQVEQWAEVGNYIIRNHKGKDELYSIIDSELDTKKQTVYIYAEDDGMDLLNEVVEAYEADAKYDIAHYINKAAKTSGFTIGINEVATLKKQLTLDQEQTASARIAEIASQFDGAEVSYSFKIEGLYVVEKNINIYEKRGSDNGITLCLNKEIDSIVISKSIGNLATALKCTGGTPEGKDDPITLKGYSYDDGDIYVDSKGILKSRKALERWKRCLWKDEETEQYGGHITKTYSDRSETQKVLCNNAIAELKKICKMEVNYEAEIRRLPDNLSVGDRVNIVDDAGELYLSTRFLQLEESVTDQSYKAVFGEHLIKSSGINQKVAELAAEFASSSQTAERAYKYAVAAQAQAIEAQGIADSALQKSEEAQQVANQAAQTSTQAQAAASQAQESAIKANEAADKAQELVESVEGTVAEIEETVSNVNQTVTNIQEVAEEAETNATEAKTASGNAVTKANEAAEQAANAASKAEKAITDSGSAITTAEGATTTANAAAATANAAKLDAEAAKKDIASLAEELTTVSNTMTADYARKTELTETEATLQTQISQNAAQISSHAESIVRIDETANTAAAQATQAQQEAAAAQGVANQATADALAAQQAANAATSAAQAAQTEANTAKTAAENAQSIANQAEADLVEAQNELAAIKGRVDSTEEEIAAAQAAVNTAQTAADKAKEDAKTAQNAADTAQAAAEAAQGTADSAVTDAANAQTKANEAAGAAAAAQQTADLAKGNAATAQARADEAAEAAATAQSTANTAKANAETAQSTANTAKTNAATAQAVAEAAQQAANEADAKAAAAQTDLNTAKANLDAVTSRVGATEEEIAAAQEAVNVAHKAADDAQQAADAAQSTADTAKTNAANAQTAANNAQQAADDAQEAAEAAQQAADTAQAAADSLAVRVTKAETDITQNSEQIVLRATKEEVATTLKGYYTKTETEALIEVESESITLSVSKNYATKNELSQTEEKASNAVSTADTAKQTANAANNTANTAASNASSALGTVQDLENRANSGEFKGEDATTLRIDSSRGTVFKNSQVSTVLSAVIYKGSKRITNITELRAEYGAGAYIEWLWQRINESTFKTILSTDERIGNDGFTFTLSPNDVDTKVVFQCQLITD